MKNAIFAKTIATLLVVFGLAFTTLAQNAPPVGKYLCYTGSNSAMVGRLWIMPKNEYKIVSDGTIGKFVFDAKTRELDWKSGKYVDYNWRGWYAAPGVEDDVRGTNDKETPAILLLDKEK